MRRVSDIKPSGQWDASRAVDRVVLDADHRKRRRIVLTADSGTAFLLDMPRPVNLRHGDGLVLDEGAIVHVCGEPESLIEIAAPAALALVRLAWHLGNRHTDVQIAGDKLRIRRDHVLEEMVRGLEGTVTEIEAPFDPEAGAGHQSHGHENGA